ncbi:MAG: translation initiation factor IF-2 [Planctomycetes bacterium]|nr:translation initiation factor IF-2 [Planctomycetota bacterium]
MAKAQAKIRAKELYTELGIEMNALKDIAASVGVEVKVWNTSISEDDAKKIRDAHKKHNAVTAAQQAQAAEAAQRQEVAQKVKGELGLDEGALGLIAKTLKINIADFAAVSEDDRARIASCKLAWDLAGELGITFEELVQLGRNIGIEIGRSGYKGLTSPEKLLLKASFRAKFGAAAAGAPAVKREEEQSGPKFAAPTGNKAVEAEPRAAAKARPQGASGPTRPGGPPPAGDQGAAARGRRSGGLGRDTTRTGRQRFDVKDSTYASQRQTRHLPGAAGGKGTQKLEGPAEPVTVELPINLRQLSEVLGVKINAIMEVLMKEGMLIRINDSLSAEIIADIAVLLDREITVKSAKSAEQLIEAELGKHDDAAENLAIRAPVVTIMGHVDHGKTSLLDAINKMDRAAHEAGGITQHIGAFRVSVERESGSPMEVTFIDTPGHEAFTNMRARGAQGTDIAVIVCAADDGVMPQTVEAISHARAAGVEIDKPEANIARARQMLATHNLMSPDWGGSTEIVEVSAIKGTGLKKLIQTLTDMAEILELKANPDKPAVGTVLEADLSEGRGIVATVLVQEGTLHKGQAIVAGHGFGRVRAMYDSRGHELDEAGPSVPVAVTGLSEIPEAGARFYGVEDLKKASEIATKVRAQEKELERARAGKAMTLEQWSQEKKSGQQAELRLVIKTDVAGTAETIREELEKFKHEEVSIRILHSGVGSVTTTDVRLAEASGAIIISFNARVEPTAQELADNHHVDIREYEVIYRLFEDIRDALSGLLKPEEVEVEEGVVEVRKVFKASKIGNIAGCLVTEGTISRTSHVRLYRGGEKIFDGPIASLKRFKDEVKEVREGFDCGIVLQRFNDVQEGDVMKPYRIEQRERTLNS